MSKMNIKPLADRVLVEASEAETKTSSGIIIPDTAKEKPKIVQKNEKMSKRHLRRIYGSIFLFFVIHTINAIIN